MDKRDKNEDAAWCWAYHLREGQQRDDQALPVPALQGSQPHVSLSTAEVSPTHRRNKPGVNLY